LEVKSKQMQATSEKMLFSVRKLMMMMMMMIGLLYNEAQQDAKVAQTTLTHTLTVHRNEEIPVPDVSGFRSQTVES